MLANSDNIHLPAAAAENGRPPAAAEIGRLPAAENAGRPPAAVAIQICPNCSGDHLAATGLVVEQQQRK